MLDTIMMISELTWRNWRWLWHVYACCVSPNIIKILFKKN